MIGSSILFIYDQSGNVGLWMIDWRPDYTCIYKCELGFLIVDNSEAKDSRSWINT